EQVADEGEDQTLGDVTRLVRAARIIELCQRLGERLGGLGQPGITNVLIESRQIGSCGADPGGGAQRGGQLERGAPAVAGALGEGALEHAVERRGEAAAERRNLAV